MGNGWIRVAADGHFPSQSLSNRCLLLRRLGWNSGRVVPLHWCSESHPTQLSTHYNPTKPDTMVLKQSKPKQHPTQVIRFCQTYQQVGELSYSCSPCPSQLHIRLQQDQLGTSDGAQTPPALSSARRSDRCLSGGSLLLAA